MNKLSHLHLSISLLVYFERCSEILVEVTGLDDWMGLTFFAAILSDLRSDSKLRMAIYHRLRPQCSGHAFNNLSNPDRRGDLRKDILWTENRRETGSHGTKASEPTECHHHNCKRVLTDGRMHTFVPICKPRSPINRCSACTNTRPKCWAKHSYVSPGPIMAASRSIVSGHPAPPGSYHTVCS